MKKYDKIVICCPVWANMPAPQMNNIFNMIPAGREIELHMLSMSGSSARKDTCAWLDDMGITVTDYKDIKSEGYTIQ
jgi:hypothetical protein